MILLGVGAEMLARLMRAQAPEGSNGGPPAPDTAWLLNGPTEVAVEAPAAEIDWPLAAE